MICGIFHNPTRERGTDHGRRESDETRSLAYASGWDRQGCRIGSESVLINPRAFLEQGRLRVPSCYEASPLALTLLLLSP